MSYDRIEEGGARPVHLNESTSINNVLNNLTSKIAEKYHGQSVDELNESFERADRLTDSSTSFYSQSFQQKRQMWLKNRNLLIIIAIIIIGIIIFIAILISEPWK